MWQIEQSLASRRGTTVAVSVLRQGEPKELKLEVDEKTTEPVVSVQRVRDVPVLRIGRFGKDTAAAVEGELQKLVRTQVDKLVIDVRGVADVDAETAFQVADHLVSGEMGTLEARDQVRQRYTAAGEPLWKGRIVVLTDRGTLGAGEVLARVLDEAADATLVGEPTFGHAGRQAQVELGSGALVELTDAYYTGPKGEPVVESIDPDQEVDERSRTLREKDLSLDELILQRGVAVLEKPAVPQPAAAKAA